MEAGIEAVYTCCPNQEMVCKRDDHGHLTYFETGSFKEWREYESDNIIHYKNTAGDEAWWYYNKDGKLIRYKNNKGLSIGYSGEVL